MTLKSDRILELRKQGLNQISIAKIVGCSRSTVNYWCKGDEIESAKPKRHSCICGKKLRRMNLTCRGCSSVDVSIERVWLDNGPRCNRYTKIRQRARRVAASGGLIEKGCSKCGYLKHVEIAHIIPISSFPISTMLSEVNNISNLLVLCRNCHWEFDHP